MFRGNPRAWALTLFYFLAFGGFVAMFLYLPKLLTGVHHLSKTDAGYRAAGFAFLAVLARPAGGWIADRIGAERVLRICRLGDRRGTRRDDRRPADRAPLTAVILRIAWQSWGTIARGQPHRHDEDHHRG